MYDYNVRMIVVKDSTFLDYLRDTYAYDAFKECREFLCAVETMHEERPEDVSGDYEQQITQWLDEAAQDGIEVYWFTRY